jgi:hypothetical protein
LNQTRRLQALTLASIQVARDRLEELKDQQDEDEPEIVDINGRIDRLQRWLTRAHRQLIWLDEQNHEVGVLVQKIEMGVVDPAAETVRRLTQLMADKHEEVAIQALEHLGRGSYNQALEVGANLLTDASNEADQERLETTDQFEELMQQVNEESGPLVDDAVTETAENTPDTESTARMNDPTTSSHK